jgi:hypothetical protein
LTVTLIQKEIKLLEKIAHEGTDSEQITTLFSIIKPVLLKVIDEPTENVLEN